MATLAQPNTAPLNTTRKSPNLTSSSTQQILSPRVPSPSNVPTSVSESNGLGLGLGHDHDHDQAHPHGHAHAQSFSPSAVEDQLVNTDGKVLPGQFKDQKCGGCGEIIDPTHMGVVVAFGTTLWHVDCFRCAKCKEKVSADTNLLLLSDGSPVCGNCSYQCFVCKEAITEEAIMTGDESYHAHCFTCRTCKRRIEELVFAKTSQGIYCMSCHNERVAKSRRHAEAKRQRQARREEKEREKREREEGKIEEERQTSLSAPLPNQGASGSYLNPTNPSQSGASQSPAANVPASTPSPRPWSPYAHGLGEHDDAERDQGRRDLAVGDRGLARAGSPAGKQLAEASAMPLPASPSESESTRPLRPPEASSPQPHYQQRPGQPLPSPQGQSQQQPTLGAGLGVPSTSRAEKRRSINPGMTYGMDAPNSTFMEQRLPPSPLRASFTDAKANINAGDNGEKPIKSPTSPSPFIGGQSLPLRDGLGSGGSGSASGTGGGSQLQQAQAQATEHLRNRSGTPEQQQQQIQPPSQAPPRTTSLPDHLAQAQQTRSRSGTRTEEDGAREAALQTLEPGQGQGQEKKTPKLNAPDLPPISFSLSDPDFALILKNMDQSPNKAAHAEFENGQDEEEGSASQSLARSPSLDMLSAINSDPQAQSHPSRPHLSPYSSDPYSQVRRQASADSTFSVRSRLGSNTGAPSDLHQLVELLAEAKFREKEHVNVDVGVLTGVIREVEEMREAMMGLKNKYTGAKRSSQQYSEGLSVAGEEYDKERTRRTELETEVSRLRAQLHSQTARMSVISGDEKRAENMKRRSKDLASSLTGLERDISRLRVERDVRLAEVDELAERVGSSNVEPNKISQSISTRLDTIRSQYAQELESLSSQVESLQREITELRQIKEASLEESAALAAKNEDLSELCSQLTRQTESLQDSLSRARPPTIFGNGSAFGGKGSKGHHHLQNSPSLASLTGQGLQDVPEETVTARVVKVTKPETAEAAPVKRFKWYKSSKGPEASSSPANISKPLGLDKEAALTQTSSTEREKGNKTRGGISLGVAGLAMGGLAGGLAARPSTEFGMRDHTFQQHTMMRFTRCELCGEKMWGLQEVKCNSCGIVCHSKCAEKLPRGCTGSKVLKEEPEGPLLPSMFGRPLIEQVQADQQMIPTIVTKCIAAVEEVGMEYEGIYRKTGGSSQSKQITQLFERGDYESFDLTDVDAFNDISSVTSVLKTYFRSLPNPLFTHELHESFVTAATIRDTSNKRQGFLALLQELPTEHFNTLKVLMLHLNRVTALSAENLMTSQNLGVVFGPTLMRSSDPSREFGDMAGKALSVQWLVDNALSVFGQDRE
ncbi:hypothetical protein B9479_000249 [Cryptococcus floricola]|uniref:Signal transducer n=1 Tax=Cryptococcus floricola TaxID=2591691 RepID=A0A5D3B5A4_9TREE|nr:hypothetical protein B9479_000249 [Cryptococcus floricola]